MSGPRNRNARAEQAGFTILDVMMAVLVMTIGLTGLLAMEMTSIRANARARELAEAIQLSQDKAEELRLLPVPLPLAPVGGELLDVRGCLITGDTRTSCATAIPGTRYTRTWTSSVDGSGNTHFSVTTQWTSGDGTLHGTTVSDVR